MSRSNTTLFILAMALFTSAAAEASPDAVEELKVCARMTDQEARYACFDDLGERVLQEQSGDDELPRENAAQPLPDELGKSDSKEYVGLITSCRQGGSGTWFFFFDNGQVWQEVNKRSLRFKECHFNATITTDPFGYKMRIEGINRSIRVKRHR